MCIFTSAIIKRLYPVLIDVLYNQNSDNNHYIDSILKLRHINSRFLYLFRALNSDMIHRILDKLASENAKLILFMALYSWLPQQGSKEWLRLRTGDKTDESGIPIIMDKSSLYLKEANNYYSPRPCTIGGSELSSLRNENVYCSVRELAKRKLGMEKFEGSIDTRWGKMMEPVITDYTNHVFKTEIHETGAIPGLKNEYGHTVFAYSPDGVALVSVKTLSDIIYEHVEHPAYQLLLDSELEYINVLFEFKCPRRRTPKLVVPDHYLSQPTVGQCVISITKIGIFGDGLFRKCRLDDFKFDGSYDRLFHNTDRYLNVDAPYAMGIVCIFKENPQPHIHISAKFIAKHLYDDLICELYNCEMSHMVNNIDYAAIIYMTTMLLKLLKTNLDIMREVNLSINKLYTDVDFTRNIIVDVMCMIIKKANRVSQLSGFHYADIIDGIINADMDQNCDISQISYGVDYGHRHGDDFEEVIRNTTDHDVEEKHEFYYSDIIYNDNNNIQRWLYTELFEFEKYCIENNLICVGIMPWKLFKINYIPVWKKPNYLKENSAIIYETVEKIQEISANMNDDLYDAETHVCEIFEEKMKKKKYNSNAQPKSMFNNSVMNFIANA